MTEPWQLNISAMVVVAVLRLGLYEKEMVQWTREMFTPQNLDRANVAKQHSEVIAGLLTSAATPVPHHVGS